jgi:hypothetical protein
VKTGLAIGLLIAAVFVTAVFCKLPSDARLVEKAAVVLMGGAFVALVSMAAGNPYRPGSRNPGLFQRGCRLALS